MRRWQRLRKPLRRAPHGSVLRLSPPEVLLLGFALLCALGALLLWLPGSAVRPLAWHEALFTATSAVTVTGLSVIDVGHDLTFTGQAVLLVLIQIGGLGFMTFAALTVLLIGARLPIQQQNLVREALGEIAFSDVRHLVNLVILFALLVESLGTALLAAHWVPEYGWRLGLWNSLFHAVSAFNNAGFSTWSDSLMGEVDDPLVNGVITLLFIVGGLGFVVVSDIYRQRRWSRLAMQTKVVLLATLWLNLIATAILLGLSGRIPRRWAPSAISSAGSRLLVPGRHPAYRGLQYPRYRVAHQRLDAADHGADVHRCRFQLHRQRDQDHHLRGAAADRPRLLPQHRAAHGVRPLDPPGDGDQGDHRGPGGGTAGGAGTVRADHHRRRQTVSGSRLRDRLAPSAPWGCRAASPAISRCRVNSCSG